MNTPTFRYRPADFPDLPARLEHLDIHLSFEEAHVDAVNVLTLTPLVPLTAITLDARDLEIVAVEWLANAAAPSGKNRGPDAETAASRHRANLAATGKPCTFVLEPAAHRLTITLPCPCTAGTTFTLRTRTRCQPSDKLLEGIYKDTTPPGCPQQYMSQCQQWGFSRIMPVFDDCTAKCTMVTTIEADARYTHLISNGNISRTLNPDGKPVATPGRPGRQTITYEVAMPMAPYLFIACVGTWDVLADAITYPSGRPVALEYLVPPGKCEAARLPMAILKDSILWLEQALHYEYPQEVYRTICMERSNFGGMENMGNTTIVTSAALIDDFTGDTRIQYAHGVIVHEFEHNQCGSEVTMRTPFDMWLNEAFTVDVERRYLARVFTPEGTRLDQVDDIRAPIVGPLAVEDAGRYGRIVREGFNDPDELVDGVTYVKAAEVIRMLRLLLGVATFERATQLYFQRHHGGNADTEAFFACFEEAAGRDLTQFKREWLFTIGYPRVTADWAHDPATRQLTIHLRQTRTGKGGCFHLPLALAAVDANGRELPGTPQTIELTTETRTVTLDVPSAPAFISFNRDASFYGRFTDTTATPAHLTLQARLDPNAFNRIEALRRLTDRERVRLLHNPQADISADWLTAFAAGLAAPDLAPGLRARSLRIDEQTFDPRHIPLYRERHAARKRLMAAAAAHSDTALLACFERTDTYRRSSSPRDGIDERRLKGVLLQLLTAQDTQATQALAAAHFERAWNLTDRAAALLCIHLGSHPHKHTYLERAFAAWHHHINGYTTYLSVIGRGEDDSVFDLMAAEAARPQFDIRHPSHNRALFFPLASNNKLLWTGRGLQWITDTVITLASINENTANHLVDALQQAQRLPPDLRPRALEALNAMRDGLPRDRAPSVRGRIDMYLAPLETPQGEPA